MPFLRFNIKIPEILYVCSSTTVYVYSILYYTILYYTILYVSLSAEKGQEVKRHCLLPQGHPVLWMGCGPDQGKCLGTAPPPALLHLRTTGERHTLLSTTSATAAQLYVEGSVTTRPMSCLYYNLLCHVLYPLLIAFMNLYCTES